VLEIVLAIFGVVGTLIGAYSFLETRRERRVKLLAYASTTPFPLAAKRREEGDYRLSIRYGRGTGDDEEVEAVYVSYLRFANFGKEPIRRADIASANVLEVVSEGARVLDISLVAQGRAVSRVEIGPVAFGENGATAAVSFDFLDFEDGATVRVLSVGPRCETRLRGDIVGMPGGIQRADQTRSSKTSVTLGGLGFLLYLVAQVATLSGAAWVIQRVTGDWADVWLVAVPIVALVAPIVGAILISIALEPFSGRRKFPDELALPKWFANRIYPSPAAGDIGGWWFPEPERAENDQEDPDRQPSGAPE
jgi:hypothetical protein